jgi:MFS family permease
MAQKNILTKDSRHRFIIISVLIFTLTPLFYVLYTHQVWEDFFITFRHSQNLIDGHGLVYNIGERVHGFTSPLGVLLPALCYLVTGKSSYLASLWLFRIISILAFAASAIFLLLSLLNKQKGLVPVILLSMFYLFETKSVVFSTNGMETAFMLFFLMGFIFLSSKNLAENWILAGVFWGGLMWTRPDSIIYIISLSLAQLVFNEDSKRETLITLFKISCICIAVYLPWIIWTWSYYGSFLPHTIMAKSHLMPQMDWLSVFQYLFGPIYPRFGTWPQWIKVLSYGLGFFAYFYWLLPLKDRFTRMLSFAFFLLCIYLLSIRTSPWYFPPITVLGLFVVVNGLFTLAGLDKNKFSRNSKWVIITLLLVWSGMFSLFILTSIEMRIQQKEIETGNRRQIGLWLKENMQKAQTVYLEPLGYIGYFSQARILDYPGLVSPQVVRLLEKNRDLDFYTLVSEIKPDWIVLRPQEAENMSNLDYFRKHYGLVKTFDVRDNLRKYKFIPGIVYVSYDAEFLIFKKKH